MSLRIFMVVGEESGDRLGAPLITALREKSSHPIEFSGLGGDAMQAAGFQSLFDIEEISVMGFLPVIQRLPTIIHRLSQTVKAAVAFKPDIMVIIDSPDFTQRVAARVKKHLPAMKVVNYVCPSVWAWRPGRARKMADYVDHVLALLPFEPDILRDLGGPEATYVGHPLIGLLEEKVERSVGQKKTLLVLPGSREGEVKRLLPAHREVLLELLKLRQDFEVILPTLEKRRTMVERDTADWPLPPKIVGTDEKYESFKIADAALAASGTVLLELGLFKVPMVSTYKLDPLARLLRNMMTSWTTALPNLIVDYPAVPEYIDEYLRPGVVARYLDRLLSDTDQRKAQLSAFEDMERCLVLEKGIRAQDLAADVVLTVALKRSKTS